MCSNAFRTFLSLGTDRVMRHKKAIDSGMKAPPPDGRSEAKGAAERWVDRSSWLAADSFFMHVYEYMAEPLAETDLHDETTGGDPTFSDSDPEGPSKTLSLIHI